MIMTVGLLPFLAIGTLVYLDFQSSLRNSAFSNLEAVTNLQEARVVDMLRFYSQSTQYLAGEPTIHQGVQYLLANPAAKDGLAQAFSQAQTNGQANQLVPFLQGAAITKPDGVILVATPTLSGKKALPVAAGQLLTDVFRDQHGTHLLFSAPMVYDGKTLARFYLTIDASLLNNITQTRDGLGDTGETFLVKQLDDKTGIFVTPLRFDSNAAFTQKIPLSEANRPSAQAVLKKSQTYTSGAISYRGQPVIAVTRYIREAGLGIVGQIDQSEVFGPVQQLAQQVIVFAALLILFTLLVSSFIGDLFVRPILRLATAARKLSRGDFSARAKMSSSDEIGQLGHVFNNMAEDLEKQDQAKSDVLALISHQLRTPVTAVKGFVSLVLQDKKGKLTPDETKMLQLAFEENEKLNLLITQILDVAHADSGKMTLEQLPTDLVELTQSVVKDHEAAFALRRQTIDFQAPPAQYMINADPAKLGFVIGNLLTNASKYSPEGSKVTVTMGRDEKKCWVTVTDSGLGISHADQRKLFQKFSRIENIKRETAEGMGLGLYMAKKIVDLHNGDLSVTSRENHGSSFTIELPLNNEGGTHGTHFGHRRLRKLTANL